MKWSVGELAWERGSSNFDTKTSSLILEKPSKRSWIRSGCLAPSRWLEQAVAQGEPALESRRVDT